MSRFLDTGSSSFRARLSPARGLLVAAVAATAAVQLGWRVTGSIAAADWLGVALVVALLLAAVLLSGGATRPAPLALAALGLLLLYCAWTALSIAWSPAPSLAKEEAQLVLLYALALAVPLVTLRAPPERLVALAALAFAPALLATATAVRLVTAAQPQLLFDDGRLEFPIAYANGDASLFLLALWPALVLAAGRAFPVVLRAASMAAASICLAAWIATQSKGGAVALVVSSLVVFALAPGRLRLAVPTLLAAIPAGIAAVPLTEPYRSEGADPAAGAGQAMLLAALAALVVGAAYAFADRRLKVSERANRFAGRAALVVLVAAIVAGGAALYAKTGPPEESLRSAWSSFSEYHPDEGDSGTHLATLGGSNRYDFWRVALKGAAEEPLAGIGARGFGARYLQVGRSYETPTRTHSLAFEVLLEGGVVGVVLLGAALVLAFWLVIGNARRRRLQGVAALGGCAGWLAHASVDWIWTFPATGVLFFLLLGTGCTRAEPELRRRTAAAAGVAALLGGIVLLGAPWLSTRLTDRALADPARSATDLTWAKRLDPISVQPVFAEARLARDADTAIAALERAARKEPESVAARYVLGLALLDNGRKKRARAELEAARRLAPDDEFVQAALKRAGG